MKKGKKRVIFYSITMVVFCLIVAICYEMFFKVEPIKLAKLNVSEKGDCFFVDNTNDNVKLIVSSGTRENPYNLDGVHNKMQAFTLLIFTTTINNISQPSFVATIDGIEYQGVLEFNPIDSSYVCDLGIKIKNSSLINAVVTINDLEFNFSPSNLNTVWGVDFDEAFDIGLKDMEKTINGLVKDGKFMGECYIKAVTDPTGLLNIYYYYVGIVDIEGNVYSVIVDTKDGKLITS